MTDKEFEDILESVFRKYDKLFRRFTSEEYATKLIRARDNWTSLDYCDYCRQIKCVCTDNSRNF